MIALMLTACGGGSSSVPIPPAPPSPAPPPPASGYLELPGDTRFWLTAEQMDAAGFPEQSPFHNAHFMPVGNSVAALHAFSGTLVLDSRSLGTDGPGDFAGRRRDLFPDVAMRFVSHDGHLIPLDRDRLFRLGDDSNWILILSPGRVWSEPGDGNRSRASFPFTLTHHNLTQAHNGIATFLYDDVTVSLLRVQVVQQNASWEPHDYWGHLPMTYTAEMFTDSDAVIAGFEAELAERLPWGTWSELESIAGKVLDGFDGPLAWEQISLSALLWDGTLYVTGCRTRYGPYPYCDGMRHAVFSVTKSSIAAVALLRLAQKFGPGVLDERIEDYVTVTASHGGWAGVSFRDALGMASGVGDQDPASGATSGDEGQPRFHEFQFANSAQDKLAVVFSYANYPWGPGERVRYNSINTFALAAAMDAYLKAKEGPQASLHTMLVDEVYRPIGIRHAPMNRTLEADGQPGLPVLYSGYFPTLDEISRIAMLLDAEGMYDGEAILHPELTAAALYRRADSGIEAPTHFNEVEPTRYQMSFWSWADEEDGCLVRVPLMTGFGANLVAVLPNGATAFRFTDSGVFHSRSLVAVGRKLGPLCQ